jgi:cytochrome P450
MSDKRSATADKINSLYQIENAAAGGAGLVDDPWPIWATLLASGPVHKGTLAECMGMPPELCGGSLYRPGTTYYSVFSFAACSDVFIRKDDFGSEAYIDMGVRHEFGDTILNMDGIRHRRYRDVVQQYFMPNMAHDWWRTKVIAGLVEELIAAFQDETSVDLNARFFAPLPLHTVTSGFGMSFDQGLQFRGHMLNTLHAANPEERAKAKAAAGEVLQKVVSERRAHPRDDLISRLAHTDLTEEDGSTRKLLTEEIVSFCRLIVFAGGETTWRQMGNALYALLNHPEQLAEVIADRTLIGDAVLESLRWLPDPLFARKVKRDTLLEGMELPAGAHLHVCLGAANRDPSRWQNPDTFDIHRPFQRSVAFAAGAHSCLGQHVARQEIAAALGALLERFPKLRWDPSYPPARLSGNLAQRGPGPLHVLLH